MKIGPYELGPNDTADQGIYTGDAKELSKAIPDESIDLIFTDPVYDQIDDYRWLAETAARVLKPDSAALVWYGSDFLPDVLQALCCRLNYRLVFTSLFTGYPRWMDMIGLKSKKMLWMDKGRFRPIKRIYDVQYGTDKTFKYMKDAVSSGGQNVNGKASWSKGIDFAIRAIDAFTQPDAVIFDPFAGLGTVPAACKLLGRNYIACEIDDDVAISARDRVNSMHPPLFVPQFEQATMDIPEGK